jgi:4-hydroxy-3-polyprenylbenzoate decarboxylase
MDVLDHSCSKLGFGGKMCFDGTRKHEEERSDDGLHVANVQVGEGLFHSYPEIKGVNTALLQKGIPVLIISVEKERRGHVRELHQTLCNSIELEGIKVILYVEGNVPANDLPVALWRFCNNLDPKRDFSLVQRPSVIHPGKTFSCMGLDGTRKTAQHDGFSRDWPNIIVADETTIRSVDEKWERLNLGEFLPSPSLKFMGQMYGEEAVVGA